MLIGVIVAVCVLLFLVALIAPRASRKAERGAEAPMQAGSREAHKAPGIGRFLAKPFQSAARWFGRSARGGRKARAKMRT